MLGLCGGYQMLGRSIADPRRHRGPRRARSQGLGLLDVETVSDGDKTLAEVSGTTLADGAPFTGYEMHMGVTDGRRTARGRFAHLATACRGRAVSADGRVVGTYIHGLFADDGQRAAWLERLGGTAGDSPTSGRSRATLDALAAHLEAHVDVDRLLSTSAMTSDASSRDQRRSGSRQRGR